jgi:hypothetical protein
MKFFLAVTLLTAALTLAGSQHSLAQARNDGSTLNGRWRIKFSLVGTEEKNAIFEAKSKGAGTLLFLDTAPDNKPISEPLPAVWSELTNGRVSFSGDVELPLGTCCRELGTLILKGAFASGNSIKGRAIFITSTTDEENFIGYRSTVGTFIATREP